MRKGSSFASVARFLAPAQRRRRDRLAGLTLHEVALDVEGHGVKYANTFTADATAAKTRVRSIMAVPSRAIGAQTYITSLDDRANS